MFRLHDKCRACGNTDLKPVFDLGLQFPANDFKTADEERLGAAPLKVLFCERCTLGQLSVTVRGDLLYDEYPYVTSTSEQMKRHFFELGAYLSVEDKKIVEIGSNDGALLKNFRESGAAYVLGIDPAANLAKLALDKGIRTIVEPFNGRSALAASDELLPDIVLARHCFAHMDNWREFINSLNILCGKDTTVAIEVPYVSDMLERCEFDTIYHEHLSYVSIASVEALLKGSPFRIADVKRFDVHGGAILILIKRKAAVPVKFDWDDAVICYGRTTRDDWIRFSVEATKKIDSLYLYIADEVNRGSRVVGFGASAKSSVWLQSSESIKRRIRFICDNTPFKQGKLSPGTDIPIVPESELTNENADIAINFAWQYHDEIVRKHQKWVDGGGVFINPHSL